MSDKKLWTSRERILTTMRRGIPDRVPVIPDISNMVPARLTGKSFWDIYLHEDPPLDAAYLEAVKYFGMDGWYIYDNATMHEDPKWSHRVLDKNEEEIKAERWIDTPFGRLEEVVSYPVSDPPWNVKGMISDIGKDFPKLQWYLENKSLKNICRNRQKVGDLAIYGVAIETFMGFWVWARDGGSMQAIMDLIERKDVMKNVHDVYMAFVKRALNEILSQKPDEILIAGSASSLTLSSPDIYRTYDLPLVKLISSECKNAGVICHQHTCGKSGLIVDINYRETDINVMEPLERPPGGDIDLAEAKRRYGDKFCLKGNVNTFDTMLRGTVADVEREARACIDAAAAGGGYILSSGDQCGRDTPDENLFALIDVAKSYGKY